MRCKSCGIQLSANNLDNCPNCGPPGGDQDSRAIRILEFLLISPGIITGAIAFFVALYLGQSIGIAFAIAFGVFLLTLVATTLIPIDFF